MPENINNNTNLKIIFSITLMSVLGIASINPALPKIAGALIIPEEKIGLVLAMFALPGLFLTPVLGIMADRYGRKKVLVPALLLFGIAGVACFFAQSFELLLVFRFLQGSGAASLGALNVTLIGDLFEENQRGRIMGYNNSVLSLGTAISPLIGGGLAMIGWNYPFILPLFALPVAFFTLYKLVNTEPEADQSMSHYIRAVIEGMKNRKIIGLFILSTSTFIFLFGSFLTYLPFILKTKFDNEPFVIGIILSSMSFTQSISASQLGRMLKYIRKRNILKISFLLYTAALLLFPVMPSTWFLLVPTIIFGLAQGINVPTVQSLLAGHAPIERRAAFMSVNRMVSQVGQTAGPILMGFVFVFSGLTGVFIAGALIAFITFGIILLGAGK